MRRRTALATVGSALTWGTGCLRLTRSETDGEAGRDGAGGTPSGGGTSTTTTASAGDGGETTEPVTTTETTTSTTANAITLVSAWTDDAYGNRVWPTADSFVYDHQGSLREATTDGSVRWTAPDAFADVGWPVSVALDGDTAYAVTFGPQTSNGERSPSRVVAVSRTDGSERWTVRAEDGLFNPGYLAKVGDLVVAPVNRSGQADDQSPVLYGLAATSGEMRWRLDSFPPGTDFHRTHGYEGQVLVDSFRSAFFLDPGTGSITREFDFPVDRRDGTIDGATFYGGVDSVGALDLSSGERTWETSLPESIYSPIVADEQTLHFGTETGHVYAVATGDGSERWSARVETGVRYVAVTDARLWVSDDVGTLYAFDRSNGERVFSQQAPEGGDGERPVGVVEGTLFLNGYEAGGYTVESA
ncbi:MAG: PQQ-binding-like beta-propeller repeat protein [Halobacteriaceae archaeon]